MTNGRSANTQWVHSIACPSTPPLHTQLYSIRGGFNGQSVLLTGAKLALDKRQTLCTMSHMKTDRLDIRIDPQTKKVLEGVAHKNDVSISMVLRWLIRNFAHLFKIGDTQ